MTELSYRALKGEWGIAIDIKATYSIINEKFKQDKKDIPIVDGHFLNLNIDLPKEFIPMILKGLSLALPYLKDDKVIVKVYDIAYMPTDFQLEGLAAAFFKWSIINFNINNIDELKYYFDKENNKYVYEKLNF